MSKHDIKATIEEIRFGPGDNVEEMILNHIQSAKKSIHIMVFWLTWKPICDAIVKSKNSGVDVKMITDRRSRNNSLEGTQLKGNNAVDYLKSKGIKDIKIYKGILFHHKMFIIDEELTLMGSQNLFEKSLKKDAEHYVAIRSKEFSDELLKRFQMYWDTKCE